MIRSAPPAPFKTAVLTFVIAAGIALLIAGNADAAGGIGSLYLSV
jgi:hypothetical protein